MSKIFIADGNNWLHRSFHAMGGMSYKGSGTGAIFGFLNVLGGNVNKFKPKKIYIPWDDGRNKHRLELLPNYKNREQKLGMDYEDLHRQKRAIQRILTSLGIPQLMYPGREADDFIFSLVKKELGKGNKRTIIIGSGDKDFRQLVQQRVWVADENKGLITPLNFKKLFTISPDQYSNYLSLIGDDSDKIPGVPGFGEKTALKFLATHYDARQYLKHCKESPKDKHSKHEQLIEIWRRNRLLIDLPDFDMEFGPFKLRFLKDNKKPKKNPEKFLALMDKYGIKKFATQKFIDSI